MQLWMDTNRSSELACFQVQFEDVIAEPPGARSPNFTWTASFHCFNFWKGCWYKFFSFLCGCFISCWWGLCFAQLALSQVWCVSPCVRHMEMTCQSVRKATKALLSCCVDPCCESCGMIFNAFRRE